MRSAATPERYDVAIVSNVDGAALEEAFARFDPAATLGRGRVQDLHHHRDDAQRRQRARAGCRRHGVEDPYGRVIALTATPDKAIEWGVDETRILPFAESVGGRYSLWSSIGFPAALALGWDAFEELLEGAAEMDRHFRFAALRENAPVLAAFADLLLRAGARRRDARASSPMTSGCGCCPPISSSSRWNRTARA